ncbi:MAG: GAF domain-containing protein [Gemmatimonadaceae bacterium]
MGFVDVTEPEAAEADGMQRDELARFQARIAELSQERDQLLAVVDILQEISSTLHFSEILQRIARLLGEMFGLDRSSIYLAGGAKEEVRLVATYEDPSLRNLVVDLDRYPELRRAFDSGQTVFIPDASSDPLLERARVALDERSVRSIIIVPIRWRTSVIGAVFLRTERGAVPFTERDIRFCEVIASLTAKALRNAHRFENLQRATGERTAQERQVELERIALIAFLKRLLQRYATSESHLWAETLLPRASDEELDRLTSVAMQVIAEEAKG